MKDQDSNSLPHQFWLKPDIVIQHIQTPQIAISEAQAEDSSAFTLSTQDVSPEMAYYRNSPTSITVPKEDQAVINEKLNSRRLNASIKCLEQVLKHPIKLDDDSLMTTFKELINEYFTGDKSYLRKKILQCFAICEWSHDKYLQKSLFETWIKCFSLYIQEKLKEHEISSFNITIKRDDPTPKMIQELNALLTLLKAILEKKSPKSESADMLSSMYCYVSSYFDKDVALCETLKKLIDLIEQHSLKEKGDLTKSLIQAPNDLMFANSPFILFSPYKKVDMDKEFKLGETESIVYGMV